MDVDPGVHRTREALAWAPRARQQKQRSRVPLRLLHPCQPRNTFNFTPDVPAIGREISCVLYMCVWLDRVIVVTVGYGSVEHSGNVPHASEHTLIDGRGTRTLRTGRVLEPAHSWLAAPLLWVPYIPLVPPRLLMYRFAIPFCFCSKGEGMRYVSHRHLRILLPYRLRRSYVQQRGGSVRPGLLDFHCVPRA